MGAMTAQSIPPYVWSVGLIFWFAATHRWFPLQGWNSPKAVVLPMIALAAGNVGYLAKFIQAGMTEVLQKHYIVHARARGVPEWAVLWRHAMRPAMVATVTFLGPQAAMLVANLVIVESVFQIPGLANILGGSAFGVYGQSNSEVSFLILAFMILVLNLIIDISYRYLNPMTARQTS
jgi:ABC-type dipeptide/oligopeptide/nickel transport system permease component